MMPCRFCDAFGADLNTSIGIKQVGRTIRLGERWARRYRCVECGAQQEVTGPDNTTLMSFHRWLPPAQAPGGKAAAVDPPGEIYAGLRAVRAIARELRIFVLREDVVGATIVPEVSLRDRSGAGAGFFLWEELAAAMAQGRAQHRRRRVRLSEDPGELARFIADPNRRALEVRTAEGDLVPILLRRRADGGGRAGGVGGAN
jgi:hypothetical protein